MQIFQVKTASICSRFLVSKLQPVSPIHRIAVTTRYLINKARLFFVHNFVFGLTKNIRQDTNRLHSQPHTNLLQNTLNRLGEILHVGNHSHNFRWLGFAFRVSRPSFAMKSWISICNQGVVDRTRILSFLSSSSFIMFSAREKRVQGMLSFC